MGSDGGLIRVRPGLVWRGQVGVGSRRHVGAESGNASACQILRQAPVNRKLPVGHSLASLLPFSPVGCTSVTGVPFAAVGRH